MSEVMAQKVKLTNDMAFIEDTSNLEDQVRRAKSALRVAEQALSIRLATLSSTQKLIEKLDEQMRTLSEEMANARSD